MPKTKNHISPSYGGRFPKSPPRRSRVAVKTRKKAPVIEEKAPIIEAPVIEQWVSQVPRCSLCREPLTQVPLNTNYDILICENNSCLRYHQPQGSVPAPYRTMDQVLGRAPRYGSRKEVKNAL